MIIKLENGARIPLTELTTFNTELVKFKSVLEQVQENVISSITELEKYWHDEKLSEFKSDFKKYYEVLKPLGDELERYKKFSEEKWIPKIEEYLKLKRNSS
jgi:hypothetical protein